MDKIPLACKDVTVEDVTERFGIISIQGPNSKSILQKTTNDSLDIAWSTMKPIKFGTMEADVCRLTYVGEPGWQFKAILTRFGLRLRLITVTPLWKRTQD